MKGKTKKINSWDNVVKKISDIFNDGQIIDLEGIIYLIGLQELGLKKIQKDEKVNIMHIAICTLLEPYGYYEFDYVDKDGWPHISPIKTSQIKAR